ILRSVVLRRIPPVVDESTVRSGLEPVSKMREMTHPAERDRQVPQGPKAPDFSGLYGTAEEPA
ncbi:MAG: hypothetical protein ACRD88_09370, partial [Terriglobia bacterium]